ncbi:fetuin-B-like isoform X2 [Pristis pectinata]|uniref:fetuin-B-like isoform X2 n=1 Tax=Pristis pectinata TaxID=685728 RepID=UPI00223D828C|nr:fetuin-B-like isoform X2 [Pristis pectinata]
MLERPFVGSLKSCAAPSLLFSDNMKLLLVLAVSTQLFQPSLAASFRALSCNEQKVVKAAELAVEHINADQAGGYKYVLNKIENAQEERRKLGTPSVYFEFEILETRCHSLNPKPVAECEVRSGPEAISGDCKIRLQMNRTTRCIEVDRYWCLISPDSDDMVLSRCPACPHRIALNHSDASSAVAAALQKYNQNSSRANNFAVEKITKASSQLAGKKVFVEFVIQETTCPKASNLPNCPVNEGQFASGNKGFCTASVYKPISGQEKVEVNCEHYRPKVVVNSAKNKATSCIQQKLQQKGQEKRNKRQTHRKKQPGNKRANLQGGTPKRTESSEEVQGALGFEIGTGSRSNFPRLPAPRNICPGRARYFGATTAPV